MDTGLLVLRIVIGLLLVGHGAQKLFGWFGGDGLTGTAGFFRSVGYWPPRLIAGFIGGAELVGGAGLALGLATPLAGAIVIAAMLNVAVAIHRRNELSGDDGGYEYPLVFAAAAALVGFTGSGAVSLDAWTGFGGGGLATGLFALGLGVLTGSAILVSRSAAESEAGPLAETPAGSPAGAPAERLAA
ncbi:MAG TPA: DoxX family protein [Acidimicrobiia bacterium]|nr:DoxX family protein [Acidimicrobiia bacterium]